MRVLNIEDNMMKHTDIFRVLKSNGATVIDHAKTLEDGIEKIEQAIEKGLPYQLIVTDMNFPLRHGEYDCETGGEKVLEYIQEKEINVPVILCSSINYKVPDMEGCIYYSDFSDWKSELSKLLYKIRKTHIDVE